ncbi:hypothetical protein BDW62DRAFT_138927 [Aspergillus aurantiobrunneus]
MWNRSIFTACFVVPAVAQTAQPTPDVLCVYPLSGVYAPLQRILFYILLSFGVIGRRQRWLVAGALASAMTYCGAAAIHSFFLIAQARSPVVDLDVYGVFAATSTGIMLTAPLLAWSKTLQTVEREIRSLITLWALLILVGAILSVATIYIRGNIDGPTCYDSALYLDISAASTLEDLSANCTFVCFQEARPLGRSPGDILAWKNQLDPPFHITAAFVPTVTASIPGSIVALTWSFRKGHSYLFLPPPIFSRVELSWIGEWLFGRRQHDGISPRRSSFARIGSAEVPPSPVRYPRLLLAYQYYFALGSFGVFVVNLVMNEVRFQHLPTNEMPFEVGQWSPWVGVGLILLAQVLCQLLKGNRTGKRRGDEEELRRWDRGKEVNMRTGTMTCRRRNSF